MPENHESEVLLLLSVFDGSNRDKKREFTSWNFSIPGSKWIGFFRVVSTVLLSRLEYHIFAFSFFTQQNQKKVRKERQNNQRKEEGELALLERAKKEIILINCILVFFFFFILSIICEHESHISHWEER